MLGHQSACPLAEQLECAKVLNHSSRTNVLQIVEIGDTHGIRFPREFGLLLKQLLYFDRYTQLLAPSLSVLNDDRVKIRQGPVTDRPGYDITVN